MKQAKIKQSLFYRINHRYDQIKDPYRLLILIVLAMPGIVCANITTDNIWITAVGLVYLLSLLIFRVLYVDGYIRKKE